MVHVDPSSGHVCECYTVVWADPTHESLFEDSLVSPWSVWIPAHSFDVETEVLTAFAAEVSRVGSLTASSDMWSNREVVGDVVAHADFEVAGEAVVVPENASRDEIPCSETCWCEGCCVESPLEHVAVCCSTDTHSLPRSVWLA